MAWVCLAIGIAGLAIGLIDWMSTFAPIQVVGFVPEAAFHGLKVSGKLPLDARVWKNLEESWGNTRLMVAEYM